MLSFLLKDRHQLLLSANTWTKQLSQALLDHLDNPPVLIQKALPIQLATQKKVPLLSHMLQGQLSFVNQLAIQAQPVQQSTGAVCPAGTTGAACPAGTAGAACLAGTARAACSQMAQWRLPSQLYLLLGKIFFHCLSWRMSSQTY